ILAPLLMLVTMRGLRAPGTGGRGRGPRLAFGALAVVFMLAAGVSTLLALRAAPVGFQERGGELEHLADVAAGDPLLFLGVDRFGTYWLRGTLAESPGGYFAPEVSARPQKAWQQGDPVDFDTTEPARMDRFDWAITSAGEYGSTPPPNWEEVERTAGFVLWRREGETPAQLVLNEGGMAARILECPPGTDADDVVAQFETEPESKADPSDDEALGETGPSRGAATPLEALVGYPTTVIRQVYADRDGWRSSTQLEAPGSVSRRFELAPGIWDLSLQYASQVDIVVEAGGQSVELPASLAGMYLTEKGGGSFWPAGQVQVRGNRPVRVTISSDEPTGLEQAVGASRRTWVGDLAATRPSDRPQVVSLRQACGLYVDHTEFPVFAGSSGG
ncbi:MAG: hypothetical protein H0W09_06365, partial [Solirubrobacterales bacterium]|nr:hypothetical protein [Solirubrobacterales bacterium]